MVYANLPVDAHCVCLVVGRDLMATHSQDSGLV